MCCCSSSDSLTVCTLFFNSADFSSSVAFLTIFSIGVTSHRCDSLLLCADVGFTCTCTRRGPLNLERSVSVPVSNFVLFCSLGFLACGPCKFRSSSSRSHCGNRCLAASASGCLCVGEYPFYNLLNFVVCLCFLRCNFRRCLDSVLTSVLFASFSLLSPGPFVCPARNVKPVMGLFDVLHHLLVHVILHLTECGPGPWYSSRPANLSLSSLPAGFRWTHVRIGVVRIELVSSYSLMIALFLMVVVSSGHFLGHPRMLQICTCCKG